MILIMMLCGCELKSPIYSNALEVSIYVKVDKRETYNENMSTSLSFLPRKPRQLPRLSNPVCSSHVVPFSSRCVHVCVHDVDQPKLWYFNTNSAN